MGIPGYNVDAAEKGKKFIWFTSRMMNAMRLAQSRRFRRFLCSLCDGHGCSYLPKNVWQRRRRKPWIGDFVLLGFGCDSKVVATAVRATSVTVTASGRGVPWVFVWCEISWSFHASKSFHRQTVRNANQLLFNLVGQSPVLHADECISAICVLPEWNQQRPACCSMPLCALSSLPGAGCQSVQPGTITGRRSMGEEETCEKEKRTCSCITQRAAWVKAGELGRYKLHVTL